MEETENFASLKIVCDCPSNDSIFKEKKEARLY